jgi:hypothetical protein
MGALPPCSRDRQAGRARRWTVGSSHADPCEGLSNVRRNSDPRTRVQADKPAELRAELVHVILFGFLMRAAGDLGLCGADGRPPASAWRHRPSSWTTWCCRVLILLTDISPLPALWYLGSVECMYIEAVARTRSISESLNPYCRIQISQSHHLLQIDEVLRRAQPENSEPNRVRPVLRVGRRSPICDVAAVARAWVHAVICVYQVPTGRGDASHHNHIHVARVWLEKTKPDLILAKIRAA